jgi:uracil-DNA glycosylase
MMELPLYPTIESARLAADHCAACRRSRNRTQVVFGSGNPDAALMLVGESPSATDDRTGKPFTGPAGKLLDTILGEVGIHRRDLWITNVVRCFDGELKAGRMENRPASVREIRACSTWMDIEIRTVNPRVILAVGAPAARRIIHSDFRLTEQRGTVIIRPDQRLAVATIQPAYVMRLAMLNPGAEVPARATLASDIRVAAEAAGLISPRSG